jgi:RHS repeat-associated protein
LEASYIYGLDLIEQERDGDESYYHVDGLGSTKALTDESGEVTDTYIYDAYGNLIGSAGTTENSYRFAGEQWDETLGQYYLRQRYYDPTTGRFTRRDTYEGRLGEPITLHKYIYANANPVNGIDPSGLFTLNEINQALTIIGILSNSYSLVSNTQKAFNADDPTEQLTYSTNAGLNLIGLAFPFIGSGGFIDPSGLAFSISYAGSTVRAVGSILIPTGQIFGGILAVHHNADWEWYDLNGVLKDSDSVQSGGTQPGRRLSWQEQLKTHTERKILDCLAGQVKKGDVVVINC